MAFESDAAVKQVEATERLRAVVAEHLQPVYERLEAARVKQIKL
jgi:hypothetical protein